MTASAMMDSDSRCVSPQVLAVDHGHRHRIEIEIVEQPCVDANLGIVEVRLAARPVRRLREGAAAAIGAEMMSYGAGLPPLGRDVLLRRGQAKLRRRVIGPQRTALGAQRTGAARHAGRRLAHLEFRVAVLSYVRPYKAAGRDCRPREQPLLTQCSLFVLMLTSPEWRPT